MGQKKKVNLLRSLKMALDMLDRVEGSAIYEIQKRLNSYTDQEYRDMLEQIADMYNHLKSRER
jgi:hypothetical protein